MSAYRIERVDLDESQFQAADANIEHERRVAIFDLIEENTFKPANSPGGPYALRLAIEEGRLVFDIRINGEEPHGRIMLSMTPFRRVIKDYFLICESYFQAIRTATPSQIEAIDMGRRGLHNEGSQILRDRLEGKVELDFDTSRRLFTLICALHFKG